MFDAPTGDLDALEAALAGGGKAIRALAGDAVVRLGVADRHPSLAAPSGSDYDSANWRKVDGAVEITVDASRAGDLASISQAARNLLQPLAAPGSVEVMTGPMYPMVTPRDGEAFLSLAFKRDPATTSAQFRRWWREQHSVIAIPVLGAPLLAYDQVHVDPAATEAVSRAFGVEPFGYDAYDNLTWADREAYFASISDLEGMTRIFADEIGRIDDGTRRHALMRRIS
jgi:hypothetical protein